jgi:acetolactate synthase-1/2/3 large subunit
MNRQEWVAQCNAWKNKWKVIQPHHLVETGEVDMYAIFDAVNKYGGNSTIASDAGSSYYISGVALNAKPGQRFITSISQADMGWALPGSIGIALASNKQVISITGDGSFMSNMQELAVVRQHQLNIKFIILNNGGYSCIRNTQNKYYDGRVYGTNTETGVWFPSFEDVARTFELGYCRIDTVAELAVLEKVLSISGPAIIDIKCNSNQEILPAQGLKNGVQAGLHDMVPFLSDEELSKEMIVKYE